MYIKYDDESGMRLAMMREVWVCPECHVEGDLVQTITTAAGEQKTYQCPTHPGAKLRPASHMVPDPCAIRQDVEYSWSASRQHRDGREKLWTANFKANGEVITTRSAWDIPTADKVYVVGGGPSVKKQAKHLNQLDDGVVIAMSRGLKYVKADYFLALDHVFKDLAPRHVKGVTAILAPVVAPALARLPWADRRWIASAVHNNLNDAIRKTHPTLWKYYEGLNVTYVAMQLCATVFKAKRVVLVGIDCSFPMDEHHAGEALKFEPGLIVAGTPTGGACITNPMMVEQRAYMVAQILFMQAHGIKVEVAGDEGIIPVRNLIQQEVIIPRVKLDG